ncbi:MAG: hypothetical protein R3Y15_06290 [Rikenellaceae bacterium]
MRKLTNNEKGMIAIILMFLIGIAVRWEFVSTEISEAISNLLGLGK